MKTTIVLGCVSLMLASGCATRPEPAPQLTAEQYRVLMQGEKAQGAISEERDKSGRFYSQSLTIGINSNREERAVREVKFDLDFGSESGLTSLNDARLEVNKSEQLIIDDGMGAPIVMAVPVGFSLGLGSIGAASLDHVPAEVQARAGLAEAKGGQGTLAIGAIYKGFVEFVNAAGEVSIKRSQIVAGTLETIIDSLGNKVVGVLQPITTTIKSGMEVVSDVAVRRQDTGELVSGKLME